MMCSLWTLYLDLASTSKTDLAPGDLCLEVILLHMKTTQTTLRTNDCRLYHQQDMRHHHLELICSEKSTGTTEDDMHTRMKTSHRFMSVTVGNNSRDTNEHPESDSNASTYQACLPCPKVTYPIFVATIWCRVSSPSSSLISENRNGSNEYGLAYISSS